MKLTKHATAAVALTLAATLTPSHAVADTTPPTVTVIVSPHPDDETLRLSGYLNTATKRGDTLYLIAATDGGASGAMTKAGLTSPAHMMQVRRAEQDSAWRDLTEGTGRPVIRWGLPDGAVTATAVRDRLTQLLPSIERERPGARIEVYAAASSGDAHRDHRAVTEGARAAAGARVYRESLPAGTGKGGAHYLPPNRAAAHAAYVGYRAFGWVSVAGEFRSLAGSGFASRIVPPTN